MCLESTSKVVLHTAAILSSLYCPKKLSNLTMNEDTNTKENLIGGFTDMEEQETVLLRHTPLWSVHIK